MPQNNVRTLTPQPIVNPHQTGIRSTRRRWTAPATPEVVKRLVRRFTVRQRDPRRGCGINGVLPPGQESKQTVNSQGTTASAIASDVVHGGTEQPGRAEVDSQLLLEERDINPLPATSADKPVTAPRDAANGLKQDTNDQLTGREALGRPTTGASKPNSFPSTTDLAGEERDAPRRAADTRKLQKNKNRTRPSFSATIQHFKRTNARASKAAVQHLKRTSSRASKATIPPTSTASLREPNPVRDEHIQSITPDSRDKDPSITVLQSALDQQESAGASKTEQPAAPPDPEEVVKLRRELATSQTQVAELQKRCDSQSKDLEGTNNFLDTADKSSDSDIIQALQRLNAEVQQDTTYMTESLVEDFEFKNLTTSSTKEQISARQKASASIGPVLVQSLGTTTPDYMPMLLQIAFQAFLTSALCETASSWAVEPGQNAFISEIYRRLRRAEAQAISARWRSLTRVHIVRSCTTDPHSVVREILVGLADIVVAAGCTASQSDITSRVSSKFEEKIFSLVSLAGRLNKMFDDVISSDFEVFVVRPGERFEGIKMEDTDGGREEIQKSSVLCATHLGLIKQIPVGALWEKGKKQKMMVLKAKVLLESFLTTD